MPSVTPVVWPLDGLDHGLIASTTGIFRVGLCGLLSDTNWYRLTKQTALPIPYMAIPRAYGQLSFWCYSWVYCSLHKLPERIVAVIIGDVINLKASKWKVKQWFTGYKTNAVPSFIWWRRLTVILMAIPNTRQEPRKQSQQKLPALCWWNVICSFYVML